MFLQKSLEKKLNDTLKEYALLADEKKQEKPKEVFYPHNHKNLNAHKKYLNGLRVFNSEDVSAPAKLAKEFVKEYKDPDILELRQKPWDNSYRPNYNFRPELKKTLFEVRHGLKDVNMVKLKPKKVEYGCDTRDIAYYGWNTSNKIENDEKKSLECKNLESAYLNSVKKWKHVERNMFDGQTKQYQTPYEISKEINDVLRDLKKSTYSNREVIKDKVKYEYPAASPEKIAAITFKRMSPNLIHDLKEKQGKNIDYYNSEHYNKDLSKYKKYENMEKLHQSDLLLYGVENGKTLKPNANSVTYNSNYSIIRHKENTNMRDKTLQKAEFMKTSLSPVKNYQGSMGNFRNSISSSNNNTIQAYRDSQTNYGDNKEKYAMSGSVKGYDTYNPHNHYNSSNVNSTRGNSLDTKISNPWLKYDYTHPGKWTKLATEKDYKIEGDNRIEAWSCCISTKKDSKGCTKKVYNKMKWVYDSFI